MNEYATCHVVISTIGGDVGGIKLIASRSVVVTLVQRCGQSSFLPILLGQGDNDNDAAGLIQAFFSGNIIQSLLSGIDTEGDGGGGTSILELFNRLQEISNGDNDKTPSKSKKPKDKG